MIDRDRYITRIAELAPDVPFEVADDFAVTFRPEGCEKPIGVRPGGRGVESPDRDVTRLAAWAAVTRMRDKLAETPR